MDSNNMVTEIAAADTYTLEIPVIEFGCSSILGTRKNQQDYYGSIINNENTEMLAVVCDGMGGLSGGELASRITVETILGKYEGTGGRCNPPQFFREAVRETDLIVHNLEENGKRLNAGTTLIAVHISGNKLHWLSVGDSRFYLIRRNEIISVCAEHNYGELLKQRVSSGMITQQEADADTKRKDALTSYIGIGNPQLIDVNDVPFELMPDDILILCSDGLFKTLSDEAILKSVYEYKLNIQNSAENLTGMAMKLTKGSQDNTTVTVIHYNGTQFDVL